MELARRNNGFRKVAKWIVGAVVVAGAASGNVICDEVSEPQEAEVKSEINVNGEDKAMSNIEEDDFDAVIGRLPHDPSAVAILNSRGKSFTNQDIYGLIDHDIRLGVLPIKLSEEEIPRVRERIVELRRKKLLDAISYFDQLLSELPDELAQEASKYSYLSELPEDLANALEDYVKALNDRIEAEQDKIREAEMKEMFEKMKEEGAQNMGGAGTTNVSMPPSGKGEHNNEVTEANKTDGSMDQNPSENNHLKGKAPENEDKKPKSKPWYKFW
ncbi:Spherical Body Protein 2 truncated copy 11 (SBP2) [Babesia bovis T2Bo]|uniref:Spherical Body Protein 2 truncated copy 11 (SBP2) n=1 Tax=Babesia bovis TaxID=5865 RepID=A7ANT1_BABBO|nr:Spherical Body Protein 2 truncated copy 11 (SBP2) [Babesia bovis T2Bo]AWG43610.1 truncated spherical body protein 2 copy 11 [Babesia bovis]EDO08215.1 Spherical Body Protein 2 truncated copy 11 (SBP2) [Babesia bovis T2Bo]|eukprot:XP_001611783.1 Spherical Body Protein 2 truncated copy 11 (SBP2) [Babesia bovis T2Bo]